MLRAAPVFDNQGSPAHNKTMKLYHNCNYSVRKVVSNKKGTKFVDSVPKLLDIPVQGLR